MALPVSHLISGVFLGASLIIAIGAQNAFVLRLGLRNQHVLPVVICCAACDIILIMAGAFGLGWVIQSNPVFIDIMRWFGTAFLVFYGVMALRKAFRHQSMTVDQGTETISQKAAIAQVLAVSLLNPHVYLDTVVLLGGIANQRFGTDKLAFVIGAAMASCLWFAGLGYGARLLQPVFANPRAWQILDILIGVTMFAIAANLVFSAP